MMWSRFCVFKQKTAYEMRISDWSSDVCSSDLDFRTHGRIILSSLERNDDGGQWIHWQRCYGDLDVESSYGEAGDGEEGTDFPGMGFEGAEVTAAAGTAVMFVENYYDYQPLLYGKVVGTGRQPSTDASTHRGDAPRKKYVNRT